MELAIFSFVCSRPLCLHPSACVVCMARANRLLFCDSSCTHPCGRGVWVKPRQSGGLGRPEGRGCGSQDSSGGPCLPFVKCLWRDVSTDLCVIPEDFRLCGRLCPPVAAKRSMPMRPGPRGVTKLSEPSEAFCAACAVLPGVCMTVNPLTCVSV
jgi:hypothetical protein